MQHLTAEGLKSLHQQHSTLACPTPGCEVFPFDRQAELDDHIVSGLHVVRTESGRYQTVPNGFGGTTTVRAEAPSFRRGSQAAAQTGGKDHQHGSDYATKENTNLLRDMLAERAGDPRTDEVRVRLNGALNADPNHRLTKYHFRNFFRDLKTITRTDKSSQTTEQPEHTFRPRPNQYAGECAECGRKVAAGEGLLKGKGDDGNWVVSHKDGECQSSDFPFPLGRYALRGDDEVVKFYVANEHGLFAQASDDLFPIRNADSRKVIIEAIAADPKAAAILYGVEMGVCGRCGKALTSDWRKVGIGPVCSQKEW
jgi:hypothetical protein